MTISYEFAKRLSDAGFLQGGKGTWVMPPDKIVSRREDRVYVPTLEELVEACGERFGSLFRSVDDDTRGKWGAFDVHIRLEGWGSTSAEAVVRLWLALKAKA